MPLLQTPCAESGAGLLFPILFWRLHMDGKPRIILTKEEGNLLRRLAAERHMSACELLRLLILQEALKGRPWAEREDKDQAEEVRHA